MFDFFFKFIDLLIYWFIKSVDYLIHSNSVYFALLCSALFCSVLNQIKAELGLGLALGLALALGLGLDIWVR